MEILVAGPAELLDEIRRTLSRISEYPEVKECNFQILSFVEFEQTGEYDRLAKDKFWPGEYRRFRKGISNVPMSYSGKGVNLIAINPGLRRNLPVCLLHETGHIIKSHDTVSMRANKIMKPIARTLRERFGTEQLFMEAIHLLQIPQEVIVDRWAADTSKELLRCDVQEACEVWSNDLDRNLTDSLGQAFHALHQFLAMNLKLELARDSGMRDLAVQLERIVQRMAALGLLRLVPEKETLWSYASKLRIEKYMDATGIVIHRLARSFPPGKAIGASH